MREGEWCGDAGGDGNVDGVHWGVDLMLWSHGIELKHSADQ